MSMTAALVAAGVPIAKAEAAVRRELGLPDAASPESPARDYRVLEKEEQREVVKRFTVCRFKGYWLSQARVTKQTPGLPDLWLLHRERPIALWWETKRQVGGRTLTAQLEFAELCQRCGITVGTGDRYDAEHWLITQGLAESIGGGAFEPLRSLTSGVG
jgi:hypothetical protein